MQGLGQVLLVALPGDQGGGELDGGHAVAVREDRGAEPADVVQQQIRPVGVESGGEPGVDGDRLVEEHAHGLAGVRGPRRTRAEREARRMREDLGAGARDQIGERFTDDVADPVPAPDEFADEPE
ncbi:hypothetical protein [Amycolatopsis panacis]|uniref:hypothetical protein n=1 Tax=Amycolatopsis panacis TaxID=2340917 RepID=UPI0026A0A239